MAVLPAMDDAGWMGGYMAAAISPPAIPRPMVSLCFLMNSIIDWINN